MSTNRPIRLLIVEDEASHAEAIRRSFAKGSLKVDVQVVPNLQDLRRQVTVEPPDIVLLDLNLPDGRALDILKSPDEDYDFPILIMTSQGSEALAVETLKAGALDYIVKSAETFATMPKTVERLLREWQTDRERQRAEAEAQRAREEWEITFDAMTDMVTIHDQNMMIVRANRATYEYLETPQGTLAGKVCCDALWQHPDPCPGCPLLHTVHTGKAHSEIIYHEQLSKYFQVTTSPFPDQLSERRYFIHIARDITPQKEAEIELRKLSVAVEQSPAVVVITDLDANIEYVNPKFTEVTGYSLDEARGRNPRFLQSGEVAASVYRKLWESLLSGREWQGELLNRRKDGELFWERAMISPLRNEHGRITHYIAVNEDITTQKNYEKRLEHQATHDALTGLANRVLLKDRFDQALHHAQRSGRTVAVLLLDLDRFKVVNDSLGHALGDELLCQVARRLKTVIRETDTIARFGGDEFVVLLTEISELSDIRPIANKILKTIAKPYDVGDHIIRLTTSLGISLAPQDGIDSTILIRNADIAMYQAKKHNNQFSYYSSEMNQQLMENLELENDLRQALERSEFRLHYQPKANLSSGRICGCEALLRWQHPQRGMVSPGQFIPLAEETGLIVPIGTWVIKEACRQSLAWQAAGLPPVSIAVNLSARQFRQGNLAEIVNSILRHTQIDPALLELELTESMIMDDPASTGQILRELKDLGVFLSLDDFGTGYSSLNYLRRFPVDSLKIDQSFIRDVAIDPSGASVVTSIIDIAHNLRLTAIAEGVETSDQLDFLIASGCDQMQGYLFSKPVAADEFARLLETHYCLQDIPSPPQS